MISCCYGETPEGALQTRWYVAAMPDDKSNRGGQDRSRINLSEEYEVQYWTKKFGVSKEELQRAVKKVGVEADKVGKELGKG